MAGLSGDVDVPFVGRLPKAAVVIGVGAVIALIIWQRHKAASAPPSGTGADPYPPDGSTGNTADPNSTDPSTGATYGDEAAGYAAAGQGQGDLYGTGYGGGGGGGYGGGSGGAYPWDGTYGNPNDLYSLDPATGQTYGNEGSTGGGASGPPFSTNAAWSQYVLNYFSTNQYPDIGGRTDAIGLYIGGQQLTTKQAQYVHDATAIAGNPPVSGSGGFPPSLRTTGTGGSGSGSGGSPPNQSPKLSVTPRKGAADFGWGAVTRASAYELNVKGPTAWEHTVAGTHAENVSLAKGHYTAQVRAYNGSGDGPWSPSKDFTVR